MSAPRSSLVPIYHPELDVVSHVHPRSVRAWKRSGWLPGNRPRTSRSRTSRSRPRTTPAQSADTQTPAAPATGPDGSEVEPSAPVKEN